MLDLFFMRLLHSYRFFEVGPCRPKSRECLLVLRLCLRHRGLLLHEIGQKRCFLVVAVCHFAELRLFRLTLIRLRIQQDACFFQLAKLFFNVQQNALFNVAVPLLPSALS